MASATVLAWLAAFAASSSQAALLAGFAASSRAAGSWRRSAPRVWASTSSPAPSVCIVGGGIIGVSIAYQLSLRGVGATIVDRVGLCPAASGKAGGFLALDWNDGSPVAPLARASFEMHERIAANGATSAAPGAALGYRRLTCARQRRERRLRQLAQWAEAFRTPFLNDDFEVYIEVFKGGGFSILCLLVALMDAVFVDVWTLSVIMKLIIAYLLFLAVHAALRLLRHLMWSSSTVRSYARRSTWLTLAMVPGRF